MRNFHASSTLTSKGQITIPKSIRNILNLQIGSEVKFITDGNRIVMEKGKEPVTPESVINLILLLIEQKMKIGIVGTHGSGKTYLIRRLLMAMEKCRIIALERHEELNYGNLFSNHDMRSFTEEDPSPIREALQSPFDLIVMDELTNSLYFEEIMKTVQKAIIFTDFQTSAGEHTANQYTYQEVYPDVLVHVENKDITSIQRFTYSSKGTVQREWTLYTKETHIHL